MKKNLVLRIGALALAGCCITMTMLSGTFAKYTSSVSGAATATVAKWNVAFKAGDPEADMTDSTSFTLADTRSGFVAADRIAPGVSGKIPVIVDCTDTEVKTEVTIKAESIGNLPIKFYSDEACTDEIKNGVINATVELNGSKKVDTIVYWKWNDGEEDTTLGKAADGSSNDVFKITMTATQVTGTDSVTP